MKKSESAPIQWFYEDVRQGYVVVVKKLLERFPFKSEVITKCIVILDPNQCTSVQEKEVLFLIDRFPPDLNDAEIDIILEEW